MSDGKIKALLEDGAVKQVIDDMEADAMEATLYAKTDEARRDNATKTLLVREFRSKLEALAADPVVERKRAVA